MQVISTGKRIKTVKIQKAFIWTIFILAFLAGCSGNYGKLKNQSRADSKETQKKLIANWSDYTIWYQSVVIVFDPEDDDKTLLVSDSWGTVKDQKMWTEIIKANITGDGDIDPRWADYAMTGIREMWSPDNQFYGYIIQQTQDGVSAKVVDANTMRIYYRRARYGSGP